MEYNTATYVGVFRIDIEMISSYTDMSGILTKIMYQVLNVKLFLTKCTLQWHNTEYKKNQLVQF